MLVIYGSLTSIYGEDYCSDEHKNDNYINIYIHVSRCLLCP